MSARPCANRDCRREAPRGRSRCNRCRNREARERDPARYAYHRLKANAKRRGKLFDLTLEEFRRFATATDYLKAKGRRATCYHVDRIDERRGYTADNIQPLTNRANVRKYVTFAYGHGDPADPDTNDRGMWFSTRIATAAPAPTAPF